MMVNRDRQLMSKVSTFGIIALIFFYGISVVKQFCLDVSLLEFRLNKPVATELNIGFESENPELLTYQANALAMKGYELKSQGGKEQDYKAWFKSAIALADRASQLKPMAGEPYRQLANYYWNLGASPHVVGYYIAKLQDAEPFERSTIFSSLRYYLSFWPYLSVNERKQAISYLFETDKYNIYYELIGAELRDSKLRRKACQIYAFSGKKIEFCMKEFVELYY